jgi:hypothetical protein
VALRTTFINEPRLRLIRCPAGLSPRPFSSVNFALESVLSDLSELRLVRVSSFYSNAELSQLDKNRRFLGRAEFQRSCCLGIELPAVLPSEWHTTFAETARTRANFTQIADFVNKFARVLNTLLETEGEHAACEFFVKNLGGATKALDEFRSGLVDAKPSRAKR